LESSRKHQVLSNEHGPTSNSRYQPDDAVRCSSACPNKHLTIAQLVRN